MFTQDYIIGLVDGEGSFTVYVKDPNQHKKVKRRTKVEPRFYLKLVEGDKSILYKLKRFFGCGNVYFQKDNRPNHQNCYRYEVANRKDLTNIIIPFFKKHQLKIPSKSKDFRIFCRMMNKINQGKHLKKLGLKELYELKSKMH